MYVQINMTPINKNSIFRLGTAGEHKFKKKTH